MTLELRIFYILQIALICANCGTPNSVNAQRRQASESAKIEVVSTDPETILDAMTMDEPYYVVGNLDDSGLLFASGALKFAPASWADLDQDPKATITVIQLNEPKTSNLGLGKVRKSKKSTTKSTTPNSGPTKKDVGQTNNQQSEKNSDFKTTGTNGEVTHKTAETRQNSNESDNSEKSQDTPTTPSEDTETSTQTESQVVSKSELDRSQPLHIVVRTPDLRKLEKTFPDVRTGSLGQKRTAIPEIFTIHQIVKDRTEFTALLQGLESRLGREKMQGKEMTPELLKNILREKEAQHGFPDIEALPAGVLSPQLFLSVTHWGYMLNDLGAGLEHGEFTHRLQWYAIMTKFEQDLERGVRWAYTPLELFAGIGTRDLQTKLANEKSQLLWVYLMDLYGQSEGRGYEFHDNLMDDFKTSRPGSTPNNVGTLANLAGIVDGQYRLHLSKLLQIPATSPMNLNELYNQYIAQLVADLVATKESGFQPFDAENQNLLISGTDRRNSDQDRDQLIAERVAQSRARFFGDHE